jgi:hypothetical protein
MGILRVALSGRNETGSDASHQSFTTIPPLPEAGSTGFKRGVGIMIRNKGVVVFCHGDSTDMTVMLRFLLHLLSYRAILNR